MIAKRLGSYLIEVCGIVTVLLAIGWVFGPSWFGERGRVAIVAGVLVVAVVDVPLYLCVARGLVVQPDRFMFWWGLSVGAKLTWFVLASAFAILVELVPVESYLLVLGLSFPIFMVHQVYRLVRLAEKREAHP